MLVKQILSPKLQIAGKTREWFLQLVNHVVSLEFILASEGFAANAADKRTLAGVHDGVSRELILAGVSIATDAALVRPLACVDTHVYR
jgi:hypothetical protein